ncbi:MAG: transcription antitermination factor NusB, partial [bacterium]
MSRTKARVVAMQALYLLDADESGMEEIIGMRAQEEGITDDDMKYLREAVAKVRENLGEIDTHIKNYSIDWSFERLGKV